MFRFVLLALLLVIQPLFGQTAQDAFNAKILALQEQAAAIEVYDEGVDAYEGLDIEYNTVYASYLAYQGNIPLEDLEEYLNDAYNLMDLAYNALGEANESYNSGLANLNAASLAYDESRWADCCNQCLYAAGWWTSDDEDSVTYLVDGAQDLMLEAHGILTALSMLLMM